MASQTNRFKVCYQSGETQRGENGDRRDPDSGGEAPPCQNVVLQDLPDEVIKKPLRSH